MPSDPPVRRPRRKVKPLKRFKRPPVTAVRKQIAEKRLRTEAHLGMTIEDWRVKKRQEWAAVMNALSRFLYGAAYTPAGDDLYVLQQAADRIKVTMENDWVCW